MVRDRRVFTAVFAGDKTCAIGLKAGSGICKSSSHKHYAARRIGLDSFAEAAIFAHKNGLVLVSKEITYPSC